jgi:hypothetical protein
MQELELPVAAAVAPATRARLVAQALRVMQAQAAHLGIREAPVILVPQEQQVTLVRLEPEQLRVMQEAPAGQGPTELRAPREPTALAPQTAVQAAQAALEPTAIQVLPVMQEQALLRAMPVTPAATEAQAQVGQTET